MSGSWQASAEQEIAIGEVTPRFSIRASAGAGKTYVLVQRYLRHLIEDGLEPDQILAITFTKKAAASMKQRIVLELQKLGRSEQAQRAETGPIQTIHSFCERILRENALEAGVDPEFGVLSESESPILRARALHESIAEIAEENEDARFLLTRLAAKQKYNAGRGLHVLIAEAVGTALGSLRESGHSVDEVARKHADPVTLYEESLKAILASLPNEIVDQIDSNSGSQALLELQTIMKQGKGKLPGWLKDLDPVKDLESARLSCGLTQVVIATWITLEREMNRLQKFDFTDLQSRAVRLLARSPEVAQRLREQYRSVLVDEAQDLNPMQYRLLTSIGVEREMLVGDPQQSIYGFRHADSRLFLSHIERVGQTRNLSKNFRSVEGLLRFVDTVFERTWSEGYMRMSQATAKTNDPFASVLEGSFAGTEYWPLQQRDLTQIAAWIKELIDEGESPGEIAVLVRKGKTAETLHHHLTDIGIKSVVVGGTSQFFARQEIRDVANILEALAAPNEKFVLLSVLAGPAVGLSLDSIVLMASEASVLEALQKFVPPIESDIAKIEGFLNWFGPLSQYADRVPAWETIAKIFEQTPLLEHLGALPNRFQALANVRKLLRTAAEHPEMGASQFADQIRDIQQLPHREGEALAFDVDAQSVTLMTVHKAKGLEFPIVVWPDGPERSRRQSPSVLCDSDRGLIATNFEKAPSAYYKWLQERNHKKETEEDRRVLYVAMTRAQRKLCLALPPSPTDSHSGKLITDAVSFSTARERGVRVRGGATGAEPADGTL